jgi:eukaryotic-like serine/threonine-protein kinase
MQLWTDYEGLTIDGAFPLRKLLMPEGRSAFFSTAGTNGEPTVVRLIECHFDEEEILSRWRCIDALNHPNFLKFEHFGQTELDGRPVVYAVFEKVDGNLAGVLDQGILTVPDVAQLASSLVAALEVLHTHGFIHEHIEPRNIFAIDSVVKLRGDCIREAPEGDEGRAAKQRDVRDLATVLLQALTQRESVERVPDSAMPAPYREIIRNGLDGTWGLDDIRAALGRQFGANQPASGTATQATSLPGSAPSSPTAKPSTRPEPKLPTRPETQLPPPLRIQDRNAEFNGSLARKNTWSGASNSSDQTFSLRSRWIGVGVAALLLLLFTWALTHAWNVRQHKATQAAAISQHTSPAQPRATSPAAPTVPAPAVRVGPNWRLIAFTYNRKTDAEKKVSDLARSHPELQPVVFTPSGHAPYLVSIGGLMDRDAAHALARRSRSLGLPHDIYAQNYNH